MGEELLALCYERNESYFNMAGSKLNEAVELYITVQKPHLSSPGSASEQTRKKCMQNLYRGNAKTMMQW